MRLFTTKQSTLHTALDPDAAKQRLSSALAGSQTLSARSAKPFSGMIKGDHFQLTRLDWASGYRRSSGVQIAGDIYATETGSTITITLQTLRAGDIAIIGGVLISFNALAAALAGQIPLGLGLFPGALLLAMLLLSYAFGPDDPQLRLAQIQLQAIFEVHTVNDGHWKPEQQAP
jgi:hypothetical protein